MDGDYTNAEHTYIFETLDNIRVPIITEHYTLNDKLKRDLLAASTPFKSAYAETVYLRTYSRKKDDGTKECWAETVIRVVEGTIGAYLNHYRKNGLHLDLPELEKFIEEMTWSFFNLEWSPPGRGLYAMGTDHTRRNGNASLNNCYACETKYLVLAASWLMSNSMMGGGVGFDCSWDGEIRQPNKEDSFMFVIPDTSFGWVASLELLMRAYLPIDGVITNKFPHFDFSLIRPYGTPIRGFGGTSSGPDPLVMLLHRVEIYLDTYLAYRNYELKSEQCGDNQCEECNYTYREIFINMANSLHKIGGYTYGDFSEEFKKLETALETHKKTYGKSRLVVDIMNAIGACVVAGNVRRCKNRDALVHCKSGLKRIVDVKVGEEVLTEKGYCTVTDFLEQGKQQLIKIKTQDGEYRCTPNHRMAVLINTQDYDWKMAKDLQPGDRLMTTRVAIPGTKTSLPSWEYIKPPSSTTCKNIVIPELDAEMAWFVGIFQADGYTFTNRDKGGFNAYVNLVFGLYENDIADKAQKQLQRFGSDLFVTLQQRKGENSLMVRCISKQLAWYFEDNFKKAKTMIHIPKWILEGTLEIRKAYIAGILDGDGCATSRPLCIMTSVYLDWVREVQALCYSCGFETRIREQTKDHKSRQGTAEAPKKWQYIYHLNIITLHSRKVLFEIPQLCKEIPIKSKSHQGNGYPTAWFPKGDSNSNQINIDTYERKYGPVNSIPVEVVKIEMDTIEETYDLTVEGRHEFYCDGYLGHNSAEISLADAGDKEFIELKNFDINPERSSIAWMSNNTIRFSKDEDFETYIPEISKRILANGEPGFLNLINIQKYGRYTDTTYGPDAATLVNPCSEICLESFEPCTLATIIPINCRNADQSINVSRALRASEFATFYASTVTTIRHHWGVTNAVIARNRRIGISLTGIADIYDEFGFTYLTSLCRKLYKTIRAYNSEFARKSGIPRAIRVTTVKPEGSLSILTGGGAGVHFPICRYARRRIGIAKNDPILGPLIRAGYETEESTYNPTMLYVIFPIENGKCRSEREVSIYEQFGIVSALQRSYVDNAVSFTGHFSIERESKDVERVIAMYAPQIKCCSMLPYSDDLSAKPAYAHMPFEEIDRETYLKLISHLRPVDWTNGTGNDATAEPGCTGDKCFRPE